MKKNPILQKVRTFERGFALVVTLSLMILLTLVAVGLLTLSSISLRSSSTSSAIAEARQNARMGLILAIGELQKHAGSDQRITATADLAGDAAGLRIAAGAQPLNDKSVTGTAKGLSSVQPGTRYWTGVFANRDTPVSIFTKTPSPAIVHWLVSGNDTVYPGTGPTLLPSDSKFAVGADGKVGDSTKAVLLVGTNSAGSADRDSYVCAPLVPIINGKSGKPGAGLGKTTGWIHRETLRKRGVTMLGGVTYHQFAPQGVQISRNDAAPEWLEVDQIILCAGQVPERTLADQLISQGRVVHIIGGADKAGELDAKRAIDQGTRLAASL